MNEIGKLAWIAAALTLLAFLCVSCGGGARSGPPEVPLPETAEDEESEAPAETTQQLFASDFEARKAVLAALELPAATVYYTEESLAAYQEYASALNAQIMSVTAENAGERLAEIDALKKSMKYRGDADHYLTPEGVLYEKGEFFVGEDIETVYREAERHTRALMAEV